jgi:hypothetical protein
LIPSQNQTKRATFILEGSFECYIKKGWWLMMIRKCFRVIVIMMLVMLLGVTAYASSGMMAKSDRALVPKPDQALIVFLRSTFVGNAISASIFDVSGEETEFIGIVKNGTKIAYDLIPGEHTFMVVSEAADFMKATVVAGKTYYALISPRTGAWKARFSFRPLRQGDLATQKFDKWDSRTKLVDNTPESEAWAAKHAVDINNKRAKYWTVWSGKSLERQEVQTLNPEDGR